MQSISTILSKFVPGQEVEVVVTQPQIEESVCEDFTGREEWEVIAAYRSALANAGIDLSDPDLEEAIAGYPQNIEVGILNFLSDESKSDPTRKLIFAIKQGEKL